MNIFMMGAFDLVEEECRNTILVDDMDISCFMLFNQEIKELKLKKERAREKKRWSEGKKSFHYGLDGHGHSKN